MRKILMFLSAAALLASCSGKSKKEESTESQKVLTKTELAQTRTIPQNEVFTSEIIPYQENDIMPAAQGLHIERILVDVGDRVSKGQLLATLDRTNFYRQELSLKTLEDDYNRMLPVYEAGGISKQQMEQTSSQLKIQREAVQNLRRNTELRSPLTGVVTAKNAEEGNLIGNMPILHVMQIDRLKIMVNVSEKYYSSIKVGMPVEVKVDALGDQIFEGKVSRVSPAVDNQTRTFGVEVTLPNPKEVLRPGMSARATFNMGNKQGVMIPDVAVQKQIGSSERFVYVIGKDGKAERRVVKLGYQIEDEIDILSGVNDGEAVAVTALSKLSNGVEVELAAEAPIVAVGTKAQTQTASDSINKVKGK